MNNLSIAMTASELKPSLFVVTRQNHSVNNPLFAAYNADFTMVPGRIVAQECIAILTTPLLAAFLDLLRERDETWSAALVNRLQGLNGGLTPAIWGIKLNIAEAQGGYRALMSGERISISAILRDGTDRELPLAAVILLVRRDRQDFLLPDDDLLLKPGDQLLLSLIHI